MNSTIYTCTIATPLGEVRAAAKDEALTGLWFTGQKYFPVKIDDWIENAGYGVFDALRSWLGAYFEGSNAAQRSAEILSRIKLAPHGTAYQKAVWDQLLKIPCGATATYGEIARRTAAALKQSSASAQAAGGAVGHNPISLVIPCHRVIGADGSLTGYAGGLDRKKALLELERGGTL
ncbi:methylated-DNA--protein-cysteine methyltransferase [Spirochaetia bacterium]|nr:methylated-DNA--protein-cysteine methyltransferase [Spirochaetia bacterium]